MHKNILLCLLLSIVSITLLAAACSNTGGNGDLMEAPNTPMNMETDTTIETPLEVEMVEPLEFQSLQLVQHPDCDNLPIKTRFPNSLIVEIEWQNNTYNVLAELANTSSLRQQGLMCRLNIGDGEGMFFAFGARQPPSAGFWMFNTYHPLDILYINADEVVGFRTMLPCIRNEMETAEWRDACGVASQQYRSQNEYTATLELPAGWLAEVGLNLDDFNENELAEVKVSVQDSL